MFERFVIHSGNGLLVHNNVSRLPVRLVDSFTAPKDILQVFAVLTEEENNYSFCKSSLPSP